MFALALALLYLQAANYLEYRANTFPEMMYWLAAIPLFVYGRKIFRHGKQLALKGADELLLKDTRPPVLYLRSFVEDELTGAEMGPSGVIENVVASFSQGGTYFFDFFFKKSEEEQLASTFRKLGPCVAVGIPDERLPPLGMLRLYFRQDEWQGKVEELISKARVIVLRAGHTKNFWWEVSQAITLARPERLLFLLPFPTNPALASRESSRYVTFREEMEKRLPCKLPEFYGRSIEEGSLTGVLFFGPDWVPHVVAFDSFGPAVPLKTLLKKSLKPFFSQLKKGKL